MGRIDNRADVDALKQLLTQGWNRVPAEQPNERAYAFGIYTNDCGQYMFPFFLGEEGLGRAAQKYASKGKYSAEDAAKRLRWSTADSPHAKILGEMVYSFDGRPDVFGLSPTAAAREIHYRLTAGCTALQELDEAGLFGTGENRKGVTLYIEGGDVNREWILKWAKKLNPSPVYKRFAMIGTPDETVGTFVEFGTKKVYETKEYAQSVDRKLIAAATHYQLFLFDTTGPKQLFARALPDKTNYVALGGVGMSADGELIAVIPFGRSAHTTEFFIVTGPKGSEVKVVSLQQYPCAVAVAPSGNWIALTDQSGELHIFDATGQLIHSMSGHAHWPRGIAVSPDGEKLATGDSRSLIVWKTADWSKRWTVDRPIDSIDFDSAGRQIACCGNYAGKGVEPKSVVIFETDSGEIIREVFVDGFRVKHTKFSPDGRHLVCAMRVDSDGYAGTKVSALVEVETGKIVDRLVADFEQVRDFAFLPHRNEIAVAVFGHTRRPLVLWKPKAPVF